MHILLLMAVATVLIITWFTGNLFACVFLSIAPGLGLLIFALQLLNGTFTNGPIPPLLCVGLLVLIWAPRHYRAARVT